MYLQFYGLERNPFSLQPDPDFYFSSRQHQEAETLIEYTLSRGEGILVITGEVGCGKSTLVHTFFHKSQSKTRLGVISNPTTLTGGLFKGILLNLAEPFEPTDETTNYARLKSLLQRLASDGRRLVLIIDEAQTAEPETLDKLRLLTNPDPTLPTAIQLILVGQPQLNDHLYDPDMQQLLQRVITHHHLDAFDDEETARYIAHRLNAAGRQPPLFTDAALSAVYRGSKGVPRLINMLCDLTLVFGYAEGLEEIDEGIVAHVARERGIGNDNLSQSGLVSAPRRPALKTSDKEIAIQLFPGRKAPHLIDEKK